MSFVIVARDALAAAAADLAQIGSAVNAGNLAAANPTTAVAAAAADEVSAALAALFGAHAREYQAAAAQAAAYHEQFVHRLSAAATSYAVTEVTIATSLRGAGLGARVRFRRVPSVRLWSDSRDRPAMDQQPGRRGARPDCQCADKRAARPRSDRQRRHRDGGSSQRWPRRFAIR